jgi:8-oxo-dGTP pyrophosphatase MutT (NUDIX family)
MENVRHKKVQIIVIEKENLQRLLLLQTKEDRNFHWQNITGSVDGDESFEEAARRELLEESGLKGEIHILDTEFTFKDRWNKNVIEKVFLALVSFTEKVSISSQEHQDFKWKSISEINREDFGYESNWLSFLSARKFIEDNY